MDNQATPEMLELMSENEADSADASYIAALKVQRDQWERECVAAQSQTRRLTRQNKILQLRIEQLEKQLSPADAAPATPATEDQPTQQERLN